ncbi:exo-alpha-sialidase [Devosia algicola]|uniref:Exo-alpha-sialidase n=1 Tax=Devosia algicola TaxID=3026418 RepID=A0ABY7YLK4_9HYPH|nr:exo-alpha-sialidase [Devosia algicola]WDR02181.1 exo-alpha-sialidase [Devosia algicola]
MSKMGTVEQIKPDGLLRDCEDDPALVAAYLPSKDKETHASFLLTLNNGDLVCAWFAGSEEGKPDVSIYFSRLPKGADRWEGEVKLSDDPERSEQNPVLFETPDGELWLLYTAQLYNGQDTSIVRRRVSRDQGTTWDPVEPVVR